MMSMVLTRLAPSIWSRLLLLVGTIVGVVWIVLAISMVFLQDVQKEYSSLANSRIPRLEMSSQIAEDNARLAAVSTSILGGDLSSFRAGVEIEKAVGRLTDSLANIDKENIEPDLEMLIADIRDELNGLAMGMENLSVYSEQLNLSTAKLRWLNLDVQEEVRHLDSDLDLSMDFAMAQFLMFGDSFDRRELMKRIQGEMTLHDKIAQLGEEVSRAVSFVIQGSNAVNEQQLSQYYDLCLNSFRKIDKMMAPHDDAASYVTLIQTIGAIKEVAHQENGIYSLRRNWLDEQARTSARSSFVQQKFRLLREKLSAIGKSEWSSIYRLIHALSTDLSNSVWLVLWLTLLSGLVGVWVLFGYIHGRIVKPLEELGNAMLALSEGKAPVRIRHKGEDEIGKLANAVEVFQESVLDRQDAFERLRKTQTQLVQAGKMASLGSLSAGVAHELNQPLAALRYRTHLLEGEFREMRNSGVVRQLGLISGLMSRMENTIQQLRRFARRSEFASESLQLVTLVDNALTIVAGRLEAGSIPLSIDCERRNIRILGDSILVEQVLVNLLSNAIDAIEEAGSRGEISISIYERSDSVILKIVDSGVGLQDLEPEQAIDPFVTTKKAGVGLGLGLSISYNIVQDMGGDLWLERLSTAGTMAVLQMKKGE